MYFDGRPKKNQERVRDTSLWEFNHTGDRKVWGISLVSCRRQCLLCILLGTPKGCAMYVYSKGIAKKKRKSVLKNGILGIL